jgi:hypothetical protein
MQSNEGAGTAIPKASNCAAEKKEAKEERRMKTESALYAYFIVR